MSLSDDIAPKILPEATAVLVALDGLAFPQSEATERLKELYKAEQESIAKANGSELPTMKQLDISEYMPSYHIETPTAPLRASSDGGSFVAVKNQSVVVESDHPYKPAEARVWRIELPKGVAWSVLRLDPRSATAQDEDK